jgi:biopolymer transport protein ExbB/TolQ
MHALEVIREGWPVLSILLGCSILSITIALERLVTLRQARLPTHRFVDSVIDILNRQGLSHAVAYCERFAQPLAVVVRRVLVSDGTVSMRERAYRHVLRGEAQRLKRWVPWLGTIASTSPFIGLFGTVVGIIKAFGTIARNVGGGPEVVAGGIAEALVTTAAGLVVAIPAIICYNYFQTHIRELVEDVDLAAHEVLDTLMHTEPRRES